PAIDSNVCSSFFPCLYLHPDLQSFPTRRSSDLSEWILVCGSSRKWSIRTRIFTASIPIGCCISPDALVRNSATKSYSIWLATMRSEEHTSELQSRSDLVCRLLLEKKKQNT